MCTVLFFKGFYGGFFYCVLRPCSATLGYEGQEWTASCQRGSKICMLIIICMNIVASCERSLLDLHNYFPMHYFWSSFSPCLHLKLIYPFLPTYDQ